jgi:phosphotransferase system  glucose/maltose/N-acetylglucosamine-specific IIC component
MEAFLPMWILGAPAVALAVDWMVNNKKRGSDRASSASWRAPSAMAVR